jgi:hypothetical protein
VDQWTTESDLSSKLTHVLTTTDQHSENPDAMRIRQGGEERDQFVALQDSVVIYRFHM